MKPYDLVVSNGLVMDPASRFHGEMNIGVRNGRIATLTLDDISAHRTIDAAGLGSICQRPLHKGRHCRP